MVSGIQDGERRFGIEARSGINEFSHEAADTTKIKQSQ